MEKKSRLGASTKEKTPSIIVESSRNEPFNGFVSEFNKYAEENELELLPEFVISSSSGVPVPAAESRPTNQKLKEDSPIIHLVYESGRKWDSLKEIKSKDKEISVCVLHGLLTSMEKYNTVTVLKLQGCSIDAFGITIIEKMLVEVGSLRDLNLDRNPNAQENFHLLCNPLGNLQYLSLSLCMISDIGIQKICNALEYKDPPCNPKLLALNLAYNHISNVGAGHIGEMLRRNRSLQSLDLCGNRISDEGASLIINELKMSTLTHSEIVEKRRRKFAELIVKEERDKNGAQNGESRAVDEDQGKSSRARKKTSLTGRSKRSSLKLSAMSIKTEDHTLTSARTSLQKRDLILEEDVQHPFLSETLPLDGNILTIGNFQLQHLNLSYNSLTPWILNLLINLLYYQIYLLQDNTKEGLLHVSIEGNGIARDSNEDWIRFSELLRIRSGQKSRMDIEDFENFLPKESPILREHINNKKVQRKIL